MASTGEQSLSPLRDFCFTNSGVVAPPKTSALIGLTDTDPPDLAPMLATRDAAARTHIVENLPIELERLRSTGNFGLAEALLFEALADDTLVAEALLARQVLGVPAAALFAEDRGHAPPILNADMPSSWVTKYLGAPLAWVSPGAKISTSTPVEQLHQRLASGRLTASGRSVTTAEFKPIAAGEWATLRFCGSETAELCGAAGLEVGFLTFAVLYDSLQFNADEIRDDLKLRYGASLEPAPEVAPDVARWRPTKGERKSLFTWLSRDGLLEFARTTPSLVRSEMELWGRLARLSDNEWTLGAIRLEAKKTGLVPKKLKGIRD